MSTGNRTALVALMAALALASQGLYAQSAGTPGASHPIVGAWRFVRYQTWDATGAVSTPFGAIPSGYIVFDPSGIAVVQLSTGMATGDATQDVSFGAYYGRYTLAPRGDTVRIKVEGANFSGYAGTTQLRPFRLVGDTLILAVPREYQATLVRVHPEHH